jgi:hypothetical protein
MPDWDDTDYSTLAVDYANVRRPDPRIGAQLAAALGDARTIVNVGAGTGSYEPADRHAVAVEPAAEMRARRDPALPPAIDATADALPSPTSGSPSTRPSSTPPSGLATHPWSASRPPLAVHWRHGR